MKVFTVSQINRIIKDLIDNEVVLEDITITGELSSFSVTRNVAYFTLKDNDNLLSCVQFGAKQEFCVGDMVECRGNIKYYPKGGKLSLNTFSVQLCGQGELYQQFLKMKAKLQEEGLFNEEHKIPLPRFISSVGVVTSKTGAVLQDIKNVSSRRNPNLDLYVYDAQVQGKYAVAQVIEGISYFDNFTDVDVIIVARGGGSLEDLMPFNDEELARVAFYCNKPLISAVGHETDFSILDFVADLRAPTPSAAAELVTYSQQDVINYVKDLLNGIASRVETNFESLLNTVNYSMLNIERQTNELIADENLYIHSLLNRMDKSIDNKLNTTKYSVDLAVNTLDKLSPTKLLMSGYSYVTQNNKPITSSVKVGDLVEITTQNTKLKAEIKEKEKFNVRTKR